MNDDKLDPELLKKMLMGGFSSSFSNKTEEKKNKNIRVKRKEIDLHFNKLYTNKASLPAGEKLKLQLEALEECLYDNQGKVKQLIVIVGKGEGVLKKSVTNYLRKNQMKYSEALEPPYFGNALRVHL